MQLITAQLQLFLLTYTSSLLPTLQIFLLQQAICNSYKNILKVNCISLQNPVRSAFLLQDTAEITTHFQSGAASLIFS